MAGGDHPARVVQRVLLLLAPAIASVVASEFIVVGLLPLIARDLDVPLATAGRLTGMFALSAAVAGPVLTLATSRMSPRLEVSLEIEPSQQDTAMSLIASLDSLTVAAERVGMLRVGGIARERVPMLASRLIGAGISLYRLEPHEPTLTDAYFALQTESRGKP